MRILQGILCCFDVACWRGSVSAGLVAQVVSSRSPTPVIVVRIRRTRRLSRTKHYVVLVIARRLRYDYPRRYGERPIVALGFKACERYEGMVSSPSVSTMQESHQFVTD